MDAIEKDFEPLSGQLPMDYEKFDNDLPDGRPLKGNVDEDFDFGQALGDIHVGIEDLNQEAAELAKRIQKNFEGLGV